MALNYQKPASFVLFCLLPIKMIQTLSRKAVKVDFWDRDDTVAVSCSTKSDKTSFLTLF